MRLTARLTLHQVLAETIVKLRHRDRAVHAGANEKIADVRVGLEQHGRREQHVVNPNDAVFVKDTVIEKRRASVQREIQGVMQIVVEVRAGADQKVDQPVLHHLVDAAAEARRRHRAGDRQSDHGVVLGIEHLLRKNLAGFGETAGVEGLKSAIDQLTNCGSARRPIVGDRLSGQILARTATRRSGSTMWHGRRR